MKSALWLPDLGRSIDNLMLHKLRTLLTMLGMIFGVAAVVAMLSIGAGGAVLGCLPDGEFGLTSATSADCSMFSTTARLSVQARTRTSCASKPPPARTYTVGLPLTSKTAVRGT